MGLSEGVFWSSPVNRDSNLSLVVIRGRGMLIGFDDVARIGALTEQRVGSLEFECSTLGLWDGFEADLDGPMRATYRERAKSEQRRNPGILGGIINAIGATEYGNGIEEAHTHRQAGQYWQNVRGSICCGEISTRYC